MSSLHAWQCSTCNLLVYYRPCAFLCGQVLLQSTVEAAQCIALLHSRVSPGTRSAAAGASARRRGLALAETVGGGGARGARVRRLQAVQAARGLKALAQQMRVRTRHPAGHENTLTAHCFRDIPIVRVLFRHPARLRGMSAWRPNLLQGTYLTH